MKLTVEQIAKVCHETNRAFCQVLGDNSQLPWEEAPEWQTSSAINGVRFHLANPDVTAEQSHENWLKQKQEEGWKLGPVKDVEKKEHPCFRPYSELPIDQQKKDSLFKGVVIALFLH